MTEVDSPTEFRGVPFEIKFADGAPEGRFEGYASVFGEVDTGGDLVAPGAFSRTLTAMKASGRQLPMYMQHGGRMGADPRPVGVWEGLAEDTKGLKVAGRLIGLDTETGRYNLALVKEGAMRGLSIGYKAIQVDYGKSAAEPRRTLRELALFEISIVDNPMLASARITAVKRVFTPSDFPNARVFEEYLRDAGFSKAFARAVTNHGFKAAADLPDVDAAADIEVAQAAKSATAAIGKFCKG